MRKILILTFALLTLTACQESMEERAARDAKETTVKKCPIPLDAEGRVVLESIDFDIPTRTWCQNFLLLVDSGAVIEDNQIRGLLIDELRNTPSYKPYMESRFNFKYVYCNMRSPGDTVINLTLTPRDYE